MDIPEKLREVLKKDGVVAIATLGENGPHMVNTWNSYVRLTDDGRMLIPALGEAGNLAEPRVQHPRLVSLTATPPAASENER